MTHIPPFFLALLFSGVISAKRAGVSADGGCPSTAVGIDVFELL